MAAADQVESISLAMTMRMAIRFVMEVDPGFSSACTEYLLVHILGDLLTAAGNITHLKVEQIQPMFHKFLDRFWRHRLA